MSEIQNQHTSEDEIDLIELFKKVYNEKKLIFKVTLFANKVTLKINFFSL